MKPSPLRPRQAINKAFLKVKPVRSEIEKFKFQLARLLKESNDTESEEFHKNLVSDFLKKTYYEPNNFINTKGRNDLVIHNGKKASSSVGVIIEAKKPTNKAEMLSRDNINTKAFQELILYYLRERITNKNLEIKHLIATNIYEWFIFDATVFDKAFAQNKKLVKQFEDFEARRLAGKTTDFFYKEIASPAIANLKEEIPFAYFNLHEFEDIIESTSKKNENKLIALFKLLSPEHLLKLPFTNDSNTLDKRFYSELLHIIGLQETKKGSKKLIGRSTEKERNSASLLENTINQLDSLDKIGRLDHPGHFGETQQERLFNVALELVITWINRVLFLKLLEAQLINYHKGNNDYAFLTTKKISDFDGLNSLFFQVLARKEDERNNDVRHAFKQVPYLNSSLFEPTELEHQALFISNLPDTKKLTILSATVLKDNTGKKRSGELPALEYLFSFLDAYDFAGEGSEEIQEDSKPLINASVLGLIFEKINGYKEGSFFTPGFITMYMSCETIRRAVVQKFNESKDWQCDNLDDLYDKIDDRDEANNIINSLKIVDPAVGSGHFLVSALNEIISIKNDLKILQDRNGRRLKEYQVEVVNDELIVTDEDGEFFEYNYLSPESRSIQKTLFHEKQTIIEQCLFGVDINPNSVNICRLRLWIELLKNAYYKTDNELETLPNLDINIKCGNSLISRFGLDADLGEALKKSKWNISSYRLAVDTYRNAKNKEEKREMERLITNIKGDFRSEILRNDSKLKKLARLKGELIKLTTQTSMFEMTAAEKKAWNKKVEKLTSDIAKIETEIEEIKNNKVFENAFEWRFEFPEVLNDEGDFVGFDVVIGNPPYIRQEEFSEIKTYLKTHFEIYHSIADLLTYFVERGYQILKPNGFFEFIISNKFTRTDYGKVMRAFLLSNTSLTHFIDFSGLPVFDEATVDAAVLGFEKNTQNRNTFLYADIEKNTFNQIGFEQSLTQSAREFLQNELDENTWAFESPEVLLIKHRVEEQGIPLKDWDITINYGIKTGYNKAFVIDGKKKDELIARDPKSVELLKPLLRGRDIQKYYPDFEDLWLIATFPSKDYSIDEYPVIKEYLMSFGKRLEQSGEKGSRKNTTNKWFEIQDNIAYWEDFEKPKIIYPNMTKYLPFVIDLNDHYYHNDKSFHLVSERIYWLGAFFNSSLFKYCFKDNFAELLGGTRELRKVFFEPIPVKQVSKEEEIPFKEIVTQILNLKKQNPTADTTALEKEINQMVYALYGLTGEEIGIVESAT